MLKTYLFIFALIIIVILSFKTFYFRTLEPLQFERITDKTAFIKIMLRRSLTHISNEKLTALIQKSSISSFYLVPISIPIHQLAEQCHATFDCFGVVYVDVSQIGNKQSQIIYQIEPLEKSFQLACTWVETYNHDFLEINEELIQQIQKRALKWINICFLEVE